MNPIRRAIKSPDKSSWDKFTTPKPKGVICPDCIAFCLWCGKWLTEDDIKAIIKTKRCPECGWMLFRFNSPGAREEWQEERAKQPEFGG